MTSNKWSSRFWMFLWGNIGIIQYCWGDTWDIGYKIVYKYNKMCPRVCLSRYKAWENPAVSTSGHHSGWNWVLHFGLMTGWWITCFFVNFYILYTVHNEQDWFLILVKLKQIDYLKVNFIYTKALQWIFLGEWNCGFCSLSFTVLVFWY